jgi:hypothetical protein
LETLADRGVVSSRLTRSVRRLDRLSLLGVVGRRRLFDVVGGCGPTGQQAEGVLRERPRFGGVGHGPSRSDGMSSGPYRRPLLPVCCLPSKAMLRSRVLEQDRHEGLDGCRCDRVPVGTGLWPISAGQDAPWGEGTCGLRLTRPASSM